MSRIVSLSPLSQSLETSAEGVSDAIKLCDT